MKKILAVLLAITFFQLANGKPVTDNKVNLVQVSNHQLPNVDPCMDQFNANTAITESYYNVASAMCYELYQFPYNAQCHAQAIMIWSREQDQNFDQLVICQNGNPAKSRPGKKAGR
jgi:hypothetical protein